MANTLSSVKPCVELLKITDSVLVITPQNYSVLWWLHSWISVVAAAATFGAAWIPFLFFLIIGFGGWEEENRVLLIVCFVVLSFLL